MPRHKAGQAPSVCGGGTSARVAGPTSPRFRPTTLCSAVVTCSVLTLTRHPTQSAAAAAANHTAQPIHPDPAPTYTSHSQDVPNNLCKRRFTLLHSPCSTDMAARALFLVDAVTAVLGVAHGASYTVGACPGRVVWDLQTNYTRSPSVPATSNIQSLPSKHALS